jgi:hypothetical protein
MTTSTQPDVEAMSSAPASPDAVTSPARRRSQLTFGSLLALLAVVAAVVAVLRRRTG